MNATMLPADVRDILEGYNINQTSSLAKTGSMTDGDVNVAIADVSGLKPYMKLSGAGIQPGTIIASVGTGTIEMSLPATSTDASVPITVTTYSQISDEFIVNVRDRKVIPWVEEKLGFPISGSTAEKIEYIDGTGSSIIFLSARPVISVERITLVTNPQNWMYVSPSSIEIIGDEGILKLRTVLEAWTSYVPAFPRGKRNIKIEYTCGFAEVPDDICDAVNSLVASFVLGHIGSRTGGGSVSVPGVSRSYGARGKFEQQRLELERWAYATMRRYMTGVTG